MHTDDKKQNSSKSKVFSSKAFKKFMEESGLPSNTAENNISDSFSLLSETKGEKDVISLVPLDRENIKFNDSSDIKDIPVLDKASQLSLHPSSYVNSEPFSLFDEQSKDAKNLNTTSTEASSQRNLAQVPDKLNPKASSNTKDNNSTQDISTRSDKQKEKEKLVSKRKPASKNVNRCIKAAELVSPVSKVFEGEKKRVLLRKAANKDLIKNNSKQGFYVDPSTTIKSGNFIIRYPVTHFDLKFRIPSSTLVKEDVAKKRKALPKTRKDKNIVKVTALNKNRSKSSALNQRKPSLSTDKNLFQSNSISSLSNSISDGGVQNSAIELPYDMPNNTVDKSSKSCITSLLTQDIKHTSSDIQSNINNMTIVSANKASSGTVQDHIKDTIDNNELEEKNTENYEVLHSPVIDNIDVEAPPHLRSNSNDNLEHLNVSNNSIYLDTSNQQNSNLCASSNKHLSTSDKNSILDPNTVINSIKSDKSDIYDNETIFTTANTSSSSMSMTCHTPLQKQRTSSDSFNKNNNDIAKEVFAVPDLLGSGDASNTDAKKDQLISENQTYDLVQSESFHKSAREDEMLLSSNNLSDSPEEIAPRNENLVDDNITDHTNLIVDVNIPNTEGFPLETLKSFDFNSNGNDVETETAILTNFKETNQSDGFERYDLPLEIENIEQIGVDETNSIELRGNEEVKKLNLIENKEVKQVVSSAEISVNLFPSCRYPSFIYHNEKFFRLDQSSESADVISFSFENENSSSAEEFIQDSLSSNQSYNTVGSFEFPSCSDYESMFYQSSIPILNYMSNSNRFSIVTKRKPKVKKPEDILIKEDVEEVNDDSKSLQSVKKYKKSDKKAGKRSGELKASNSNKKAKLLNYQEEDIQVEDNSLISNVDASLDSSFIKHKNLKSNKLALDSSPIIPIANVNSKLPVHEDPRYLYFIKKICNINRRYSEIYMNEHERLRDERADKSTASLAESKVYTYKRVAKGIQISIKPKENRDGEVKSSQNTASAPEFDNFIDNIKSTKSIKNTNPISTQGTESSKTAVALNPKKEIQKPILLRSIPKISDVKCPKYDKDTFELLVFKYGENLNQIAKLANMDIKDVILVYYLNYHLKPIDLNEPLLEKYVENEWPLHDRMVFEDNFVKYGTKFAKYTMNRSLEELKIFYSFYLKRFIPDNWGLEERALFSILYENYKKDWQSLSQQFSDKTADDLKLYYHSYYKKLDDIGRAKEGQLADINIDRLILEPKRKTRK